MSSEKFTAPVKCTPSRPPGILSLMRYDAILIVSFGGPERRDDVIPFLENVLRGRDVPRARMLEVAEHYYHFDGVSPINQQCRELITGNDQLTPGSLASRVLGRVDHCAVRRSVADQERPGVAPGQRLCRGGLGPHWLTEHGIVCADVPDLDAQHEAH